ncbi:hypothetical protein D3C75_1281060 [compost metagenome]
MAIQQFLHPLLDQDIGQFGAEAEVKLHEHFTGDHVIAAGTGLHVGNLHAGWREEFVALIPLNGDQLV